MASGFLILPDGRCLARRWSSHDGVLIAIAAQLEDPSGGRRLREWLLTLVPGPRDEKHVGYGPWYRAADDQLVERYLDTREMAPADQRLFVTAATRAAELAPTQTDQELTEDVRLSLADLGDMLRRMNRQEPPLDRSDWTEVVPPRNRRIGPGWGASRPDKRDADDDDVPPSEPSDRS